MNINLKNFQQIAVDNLTENAFRLISQEESNKVCVFESPTGSGKTIMSAFFILDLIKKFNDRDICFLWITIGKGNLHLQSKRSLEKIFQGSPRVLLADEDLFGEKDQIHKNEVVIVNWEKIRTKDSEGEWKNLIMKDGEIINFREILNRTKEKRKIILIIDESHIGKFTGRTEELRSEIEADLILEVSATPRTKLNPRDLTTGKSGYVFVEPKHVIDEGLIVKEIIINENLDDIETLDKDSQNVVLEASYKKRLQLKKEYEKEGSKVNPLVLIQIPNIEAGDDKIHAVREFLLKKNISEKNEKLAIKLSDWETEGDELDKVSEIDNKIEFLIFKQAIDTGWDCPRAQILIKFREIRSEIFDIQTVGRILRTAEKEHYQNENLNNGYIFTNLKNIIVKKEEYNPNIIKHLASHRKKNYKDLNLKSYFKSRIDYGDIDSDFHKYFEQEMCQYFSIKNASLFDVNLKKIKSKGFKIDIKKYEQDILQDAKIDINSFDDIDKLTIDSKNKIKLTIAGNDLQNLYEKMIIENLDSFRSIKRSVPKVKVSIYRWFKKFLGSDAWKEEIMLIQKILINDNNKEIFSKILNKAVGNYKNFKNIEIVEKQKKSEQFYSFEIKEIEFHNEHIEELTENKKYIYDECFLNKERSHPEKNFEKFIDKNLLVKWWWKNGENKKDYFAIRYEYPTGKAQSFYPDYIVMFNDGKIGIFEVKDIGDRDGPTVTKNKAEQLQKYLLDTKRKDLKGGIVIQVNKEWVLNSNTTYNWERCLKNNWSEWKKF